MTTADTAFLHKTQTRLYFLRKQAIETSFKDWWRIVTLDSKPEFPLPSRHEHCEATDGVPPSASERFDEPVSSFIDICVPAWLELRMLLGVGPLWNGELPPLTGPPSEAVSRVPWRIIQEAWVVLS